VLFPCGSAQRPCRSPAREPTFAENAADTVGSARGASAPGHQTGRGRVQRLVGRRLFASLLSRDFTIWGAKSRQNTWPKPLPLRPRAARALTRYGAQRSTLGHAERSKWRRRTSSALFSSFVSDGIRQRALVPKSSWQQNKKTYIIQVLSDTFVPKSQSVRIRHVTRAPTLRECAPDLLHLDTLNAATP
jgi:hypothetical protein